MLANRLEAATWRDHTGTNDRSDEHAGAFGRYESLRSVPSFGKMIEIGCGPWTQSQFILINHPTIELTDIMLVDPNILKY